MPFKKDVVMSWRKVLGDHVKEAWVWMLFNVLLLGWIAKLYDHETLGEVTSDIGWGLLIVGSIWSSIRTFRGSERST
jgi:uncharacterized membrane protein